MKGKIAHLSSVHPAGDPRISVKECGALAAAGYEVVFVCPHDSDDVVNGIRIRAVPTRRMRRASRVVRGSWDVWRAARREAADAYHLHDPELLLVGLALRLGGAVVVYDAHEDLPRQILAKHWIPAPFRWTVSVAAEVVEWLSARAMNGIVAATPQIARRFPRGRTVTVQNFAMPEELVVDRPTPYERRAAVFAYVGGIAAIRGAFEMVAAVGLVPAEFKARLVLAGLLSHDALGGELRGQPGWGQVDYHGWQGREAVARHLDAARAGLLVIHPTVNYLESYPAKAFEYMSAGLPLIVSDFPLWRELFEDVGCAIFVNPLDRRAIAQAMTWILQNPEEAARMGARGRVAVRSRFNWQAEAGKLLTFYDTLLNQSNLRVIGAQLGDA